MKNLIYYSTAALGLLIVLSVSIFAQTTAIEGNWLGSIDVGVKLRLVLKVTKSADGSFAAKLDSIDQGANDLDVDSFKREGNSIRFETKKFGISYEGTLSEKGDEISGTFKQGPNSLPLIFKRTTVAVKSGRPQDPQKPYPYNEEEVAYENKKDAVKLAGTLTLPRTNGQHPAVILITGSGAQDRNETILGHRPFLLLADYLTKRGIAVLRVDDRGVGGSSMGSPATSENFAGDVLAGIEYLKSRKEINPKQIGLIGHSEGGMIAPLVAVRSKDVAFIVLMAGPGQTGEDILYTQGALIQKGGGESAETMKLNTAVQKTIFTVMKTEPDNERAEQQIRASLEKQMSELNEDQRKMFAPIKAAAESQIKSTLSPWFRYFIIYDPRLTLEKVKIPVLAINGENDLQVSSKENLEIINVALRKSGNKDFTIKSFPKLNHLFQTSETGSPGEYSVIEETISPKVLETIGDWIVKRTIK